MLRLAGLAGTAALLALARIGLLLLLAGLTGLTTLVALLIADILRFVIHIVRLLGHYHLLFRQRVSSSPLTLLICSKKRSCGARLPESEVA
jgi:hypothetical protein